MIGVSSLLGLSACDADSVNQLPDRSAAQQLARQGTQLEDAPFAVTGGLFDLFRLEGDEVTVTGRVAEQVSPRAFLLQSEIFDMGSVVVVTDEPPPTDEAVTVTGTVRKAADIPDLGVEVETLDFDHVIVAERVRPQAEVEEEADLAPEGAPPGATTASTGPPTSSGTSTSSVPEP